MAGQGKLSVVVTMRRRESRAFHGRGLTNAEPDKAVGRAGTTRRQFNGVYKYSSAKHHCLDRTSVAALQLSYWRWAATDALVVHVLCSVSCWVRVKDPCNVRSE